MKAPAKLCTLRMSSGFCKILFCLNNTYKVCISEESRKLDFIFYLIFCEIKIQVNGSIKIRPEED